MPKVILICGPICCGKTTYAHQLRQRCKAVLLSCDEIMLSLLDEHQGEQHDLYARKTEQYLLQKSLEILESGIDVILDWGPWTRAGREKLRSFYERKGIAFELHAIRVDEAEWRRRIASRNRQIDEGCCLAYHVDAGLEVKFTSVYQIPQMDEVDVWIDG